LSFKDVENPILTNLKIEKFNRLKVPFHFQNFSIDFAFNCFLARLQNAAYKLMAITLSLSITALHILVPFALSVCQFSNALRDNRIKALQRCCELCVPPRLHATCSVTSSVT